MDWQYLAAIDWDTVMQILGLTTGLLYLWWEYRADPRMWFVSMVMPFISMWIYMRKGLYADFGISVYYLLIAFYGYWRWTTRAGHRNAVSGKSAPSDAEGNDGGGPTDKPDAAGIPITHIPLRRIPLAAAAFTAIWAVLYAWLRWLTDSTVPLADSFTTALSIVGMWMVARKYIESWGAWFMVDAVCVGLYLYKDIPWYALLYTVYTAICWFGWRKWRRMMLAQNA